MHHATRTSLIVSLVCFVMGLATLGSALVAAVLGFGGIANFAFEVAKLAILLAASAFIAFVIFIITLRPKAKT